MSNETVCVFISVKRLFQNTHEPSTQIESRVVNPWFKALTVYILQEVDVKPLKHNKTYLLHYIINGCKEKHNADNFT